jgi:hypothetical protein
LAICHMCVNTSSLLTLILPNLEFLCLRDMITYHDQNTIFWISLLYISAFQLY